MDVPTYDQLMNPTLRALHDLGGSASIYEMAERIIANEKFSEEVVEAPHPSGGSRTSLEYRLAWARTYLKKYGLLANSARGIWSLTPQGIDTTEVDPREVQRFVRELTPRKKPQEEDDAVPSEESQEYEWREKLRDIMLEMPPDAFERLCQRLLRESGFIEVDVTGRSGDGGIDGRGVVRLAGLLSFPVIFQCKRWTGNVSAGTVRDFRAHMKGLMITTSGFTRDARLEATRDGAPVIDLIDGDLLMEKLKELGLGVQTRMVEVVEVDTGWFSSI